jgi:ribosomal protein S18 acetylase RimI-like enzyme
VYALWDLLAMVHPDEDSPAALEACARRNPGLFLVATDPAAPAAIVGTVIGTYDGRRGHLYHVAVHPDHRRARHGQALLREVLQRLWAAGATKMTLRVAHDNESAIAFYRSCGLSLDEHVHGMSAKREP